MADAKSGQIQRNLEGSGNLYINKWFTGLYTNRSPLFTPLSVLGVQVLSRQDALIDGLNLQLTPQFTLRRRYGFERSCTSAFNSSEWPTNFFSFEELNGTIIPLVDTQTNIYKFTPTSKTSIYTKAAGASQTNFNAVANTLYFCDGKNANKFDGTTVSKMGIVPPIAAPTIASYSAGSLTAFTGWQYGITFKNGNTGQPSTLSPSTVTTGPQTNVSVNLSGSGSTDPQVTIIQIYRTKDGGGQYYLVAEIANASTWTYTDSTADANLNTLIIAPVAGVNNPPPTGMSLLCWYAGRLWGAVGNTIYFSAGPDATNGVGTECWPTGNNYTVPGNITALVPLSVGLVVFTKDNAWIITGTATPFAAPNTWQANFGVASQNSIAQNLDTFFMLTTRGQVYMFSSQGITEIGFNIGNIIPTINPSAAYITLHRNGQDEGVFLSDGSTNIYRYSQLSQSWDTTIQPVGGVGAIQSIELTSANWELMMGRATGSGHMLNRDLSTWTDDSHQYSAWATIGSVTVAAPRTMADVTSILTQITQVGTYPTVAVMLNEIKDTGTYPTTFTVLPNPVPDPPQMKPSQSLWVRRHDLQNAQLPLAHHVQHLQIKITFPAEAQPNEILGIGIATQSK